MLFKTKSCLLEVVFVMTSKCSNKQEHKLNLLPPYNSQHVLWDISETSVCPFPFLFLTLKYFSIRIQWTLVYHGGYVSKRTHDRQCNVSQRFTNVKVQCSIISFNGKNNNFRFTQLNSLLLSTFRPGYWQSCFKKMKSKSEAKQGKRSQKAMHHVVI